MAVFSVDSDAVLSATVQVAATSDRLRAESQAMQAQLTQLQSAWTGAAAIAFQGVLDRWQVAQRQIEQSLADISGALGVAGRQYAEAEHASMSLFR
jgi:WXG100 family type VII secretion target